MKVNTCSCSGFSLVEVALALGVSSCALVGVMGLLSVGIHSGKSSMDESLISAMSREVVGDLRRQQFATIPNIDKLITESAASIQTRYFDSNGISVTDPRLAVYSCSVTAQTVADRLGPSPLVALKTPSLVDFTLTFKWPVGANNANAFTLHTSLACYE